MSENASEVNNQSIYSNQNDAKTIEPKNDQKLIDQSQNLNLKRV